jgi:hypothetical protein
MAEDFAGAMDAEDGGFDDFVEIDQSSDDAAAEMKNAFSNLIDNMNEDNQARWGGTSSSVSYDAETGHYIWEDSETGEKVDLTDVHQDMSDGNYDDAFEKAGMNADNTPNFDSDVNKLNEAYESTPNGDFNKANAEAEEYGKKFGAEPENPEALQSKIEDEIGDQAGKNMTTINNYYGDVFNDVSDSLKQDPPDTDTATKRVKDLEDKVEKLSKGEGSKFPWGKTFGYLFLAVLIALAGAEIYDFIKGLEHANSGCFLSDNKKGSTCKIWSMTCNSADRDVTGGWSWHGYTPNDAKVQCTACSDTKNCPNGEWLPMVQTACACISSQPWPGAYIWNADLMCNKCNGGNPKCPGTTGTCPKASDSPNDHSGLFQRAKNYTEYCEKNGRLPDEFFELYNNGKNPYNVLNAKNAIMDANSCKLAVENVMSPGAETVACANASGCIALGEACSTTTDGGTCSTLCDGSKIKLKSGQSLSCQTCGFGCAFGKFLGNLFHLPDSPLGAIMKILIIIVVVCLGLLFAWYILKWIIHKITSKSGTKSSGSGDGHTINIHVSHDK